MRKSLLIISFLLTAAILNAQSPVKDSLLHLLQTAKEDSNKVKLYFKLGGLFENSDPEIAKQYYKQAGELSEKINFKRGVLGYYSFSANILSRQGYFDSALQLSLKLEDFSERIKDSTYLALSLIIAGQFYKQVQDYDKAILSLERGRLIRHLRGETQEEGNIEGAIAFVYSGMHQYRKAVEYELSSAENLIKNNDSASLSGTYLSLGYDYTNLQLYDSAKIFLDKANAIAVRLEIPFVEMAYNLNMAYLYYKLGKIELIKPFVDKGLHLARLLGNTEWEANGLWGLSIFYLFTKDFVKAGIYADSSLQSAMKYNFQEVKMRVFNTLSQIAFFKGDTKKGYYYANQHELLKDSILNESILMNTTFYEAQFKTQKKETQIQLQQSQLRQKSVLNYLLIAGAFVMLLLFLLVFRNYKNSQKLQQAKIDELETEKQLAAAEAVLKGEEQERSRLAKDLHDGLGGMLSGIKYSLNSVKENLIMTPDNAQAFERSIDMLDSSIKEMRRVAHNMMPEVLVKYGLDTALREFCHEIKQSGVIQVSYHSIGITSTAIDQVMAVTVYRIVQELVNNSIKHASAKIILVQLHVAEQEKLLTVTVEDDGQGFDSSALTLSSGIGWKNIRSRVEFLKGKMDITSEKGNGTSVLIEMGI